MKLDIFLELSPLQLFSSGVLRLYYKDMTSVSNSHYRMQDTFWPCIYQWSNCFQLQLCKGPRALCV